MIFDYGFSIVGKSHVNQNKPCQDAHYIRKLENGWYVGAVADGVGSRPNAEEGSHLAVKAAVDFVCDYMPYDYSLVSIKSMLRTAYNHAMNTITRHAEEAGLPVENYDTTLSLAIYDGRRIIYAHSGDGAIIGLTTFGELVEITKRQKAEDGVALIPLRKGYTAWEIDTYEEELAGVLLVTDGVLDALSPYLLKVRDAGGFPMADSPQSPFPGADAAAAAEPKLYMPVGAFLADPAAVPGDEEGQTVLRERLEAYVTGDPEYDSEFFYERLQAVYETRIPKQAEEAMEGIRLYNYPVSLMQGSQDDKTIVGFINTEAVIDAQPAEYYMDADWVKLQQIWNRLAYPSLYGQAEGELPVRRGYGEDGTEEDKPSVLKWMKKWTRLEAKAQPEGTNARPETAATVPENGTEEEVKKDGTGSNDSEERSGVLQ